MLTTQVDKINKQEQNGMRGKGNKNDMTKGRLKRNKELEYEIGKEGKRPLEN
jgi:hypothetical protein